MRPQSIYNVYDPPGGFKRGTKNIIRPKERNKRPHSKKEADTKDENSAIHPAQNPA